MMNWINIQDKIKKSGLRIFSPRELKLLLHASDTSVKFMIYRHTKKGQLIRLKKSRTGSLYVLADNPPNQFFVANRLYDRSYISFDSALSFHGIIPESIYAVTSATTKTTREFLIQGINYKYLKIKKDVFSGYRPTKYQNGIILMAEPEKALADYLYFVTLKKRSLQYERMDLKKIKKNKLLKYIKLYEKPGMIKIMEKIYADQRKSSRIY